MNILLESLRELSVIKEDFEDWTELPTHEDVVKFGEGTKWVVALPGREGESFFNRYIENGNVFVGKGQGKNRILALKKPDGTIFNKFDIKDNAVNENVDGDWKELPTFKDVKEFGKGSKWSVAREDGEFFFNAYTENGDVFVGKGQGEDRVLALKTPDGTIYNKFDVNDNAVDKILREDVESTLPAQPLPHDELVAEIDSAKAGTYVNVGYFKEVTKTHVQAKFTGGRGSEGNPNIRLFKATEIYGRCGIEHEEIQAIKDKRAAGVERKGNLYEIESELGNKIFRVPGTGSELLQIYPRSKGDLKSRYYISLNDEDLRVATKEEIEEYCKPSAIASRGDFDPASPMRLNLNNIYWFKGLGHSILR